METTQDISIEPEVLMVISSYREKNEEIRRGIKALMKEMGSYKGNAKSARKIMDRHIPKTEKLSKEIELMREE